MDLEAPTASLESLVESYVEGQRRDYLAEGWQDFTERKYRRACDRFGLAQAVSINDEAALLRVRVGMLQSAVASRQYVLAVTMLRLLLLPDPRTGRLNPELPAVLGQWRSRYQDVYSDGTTTGEREMAEHIRLVRLLATKEASPELHALLAAVLWASGDPANAGYHADRASEAREWGQIQALIGATPGSAAGRLESSTLLLPSAGTR